MNREEVFGLEEKVVELENRLAATGEEIQDLANIATVITSILDIESVLAVAMQTAIRQVKGEVGAILLKDKGDLTVRIAWGIEAAQIDALSYRDDLDIARYCDRIGKTVIENCGDQIDCGFNISNVIATPIPAKENPGGVLIILNKEGAELFTDADALVLEMICRFTAVALDNSALLAVAVEKQKIEHELELAKEVQSMFLPQKVAVDGFDIAALYIPAGQVGGDFYDIIPLDGGRLLFLIGDVSNKGVPAALVMTAVFAHIRTYLGVGQSINLPALVGHLNDFLCREIIGERGMFITLFIAHIDPASGVMEYCNAAHLPALHMSLNHEGVACLKEGGPVVGQFEGMAYRSSTLPVSPGDRLFCYTDGLAEAENRRGELYGNARLASLVATHNSLSPARLSGAVRDEIEGFRSGVDPNGADDYTTLIIDIAPQGKKSGLSRFQYSSEISQLDKLYDDIKVLFDAQGITPELSQPLTVAISEAFTNAVIYGNGGHPNKAVTLTLEINETEIIADISDEGNNGSLDWFETGQERRDTEQEGGRGVGLIKRLTDEASVTKIPHGGVKVRMIKNRIQSHGLMEA